MSWTFSQKRADRIRNLQSGNITISSKLKGNIKKTLPAFPWLCGMGPMLWRQSLQLYRSSNILFFAIFIIPVLLGPIFLLFHAKPETQNILAGIIAYITLIFSFGMKNDFRGDLDQIAFLKTLPIHPLRIVASELITPILLISIMQWLAILSFAVCIGGSWLFFLSTIFFIPFVNLTNIAIQNFVFLLFPTRQNQNTPGDMQNFGRSLAFGFSIILLLLTFFGISAGIGGLMYYLCYSSWVAFTISAWLTLAVLSSLSIPMVWWSYEHFDVADIPGKM